MTLIQNGDWIADILLSDSLLRRSNGFLRLARMMSQFRTKLLLLVLLLVLPAVILVVHSSFQQRRIEKEKAQESAIAISRLVHVHKKAVSLDSKPYDGRESARWRPRIR